METRSQTNNNKSALYEVNIDFDDSEKQEIVATMDQLKKQFIHINKDKIESVKELIRAYGATYYDAPGEADELCALLVLKKKIKITNKHI